MITASIVIYKTNVDELGAIIQCVVDSMVDVLYVVDNSPTNALEEFVCSFSSKIVYIASHSNPGFGTAHNMAIQKAISLNCLYHFIVNPDIIIKEDVIRPMVEYMDKEENIGMMMPKVLNLDGTTQYLPKLLPSPFMLLFRKIKKPSKIYNYYMTRYELRNVKEVCNVPIISGCFSLLNLKLLQQYNLKGYDEHFFMYFEDFDLSRRFHLHSKTLYYPLVSVFHGYEGGANKNKRLFKIFIASAIHYFNKWGWFFDRERIQINRKVLKELS